MTNPPSVPSLDVEACAGLLAELANNPDFYHLHPRAVASLDNLRHFLLEALPGMGKDSERWRYMRDVAWHEARPAELPGDLAATIYRLTGGVRHPTAEHLDSAVDDLIAARAAQPQETSADG